MRYNKETFAQALQEKYPNEPFEVISFDGTSKRGEYYCGYCKKIYSIFQMGKLLSPNRKHLCSHCFLSASTEKILEEIKLYPDFVFQGLGYNDKLHKPTIIYQCKLCNSINEKPHSEFFLHPTCIHCGDNAKRRTTETIQDYLPKGFELIGEYMGQYEKTLFRHECGFVFTKRPKDIINEHSYCPKCSKKTSKGERKIAEFLTSNDIPFEKEKTFDWCGKRRYDFYLPNHNLLIEYNGIQHYQEVPNFFLSLEEQKMVDKEKQEKAIQNGFEYLVISYTEFQNIENILAQRLKENT